MLPNRWPDRPPQIPRRWSWKKVPGERIWRAECSFGLFAEVFQTRGGWCASVAEAICPGGCLKHLLGRMTSTTGFTSRKDAVRGAERAAVSVGIAQTSV